MSKNEELRRKNWETVASMFGLKLNELFMIDQSGTKYFISGEYGLCLVLENDGYCVADDDDRLLFDLINGDLKVYHMPYTPNYGDEYFTLEINADNCFATRSIEKAIINCNITVIPWDSSFRDLFNMQIGNVFKTKEEAEYCIDEVINKLKLLNQKCKPNNNFYEYETKDDKEEN